MPTVPRVESLDSDRYRVLHAEGRVIFYVQVFVESNPLNMKSRSPDTPHCNIEVASL